MTADDHSRSEGLPTDQFQDTNEHTAFANSLSKAQSLTRYDTSSGASETITLASDGDTKHHTVTHTQDIQQHQTQSEKPQIHRAVSYGAAAPYAGPGTNPFPEGISRSLSRRFSVLSEKTIDDESQLPTASRVSTDAQGFTYPEGGTQAWLCVFGSFCGMFAALGIMNTIGTIQTYVLENQLHGTPESTVGWIFSIYTFLAFFCGIQIGPTFDAIGPRWLIASGSVLVLLTWFLLGFCTQFWHFLIVFGICGGVGTSLVFTPAVTAVGHYFLRKRGLCTGLAAVGGGLGGVVYPLVLQALFPKVGFAWATRIIGFIAMFMLIFANLFIRSRLPAKKVTRQSIMPDLTIFRDPIYALTTAGIFFVEWALFIPLAYISSYAISVGVDTTLSYQIIAFFNVGSCFGRWMPGLIADKAGRFNTMIITLIMCLVTTFAIWLPAGSSTGAIIAYAVLFGFASGSGISLTPVCVSQLCKVENYGRYYATCYTMVSFACLTGLPIAGALITTANGSYTGVIIFTGCSYAFAVAAFVFARILGVGWSLKSVY